MNNIVLLKVGNKYKAEHVNFLADKIKNIFKVICFTDDPSGINCETRSLPVNDFPDVYGWWWKLWIFQNCPEDLYLDLDVLIIQRLVDLMNAEGWFAIEDKWQKNIFNTSIVKISKKQNNIWDLFLKMRPDKIPFQDLLGDQYFFTKNISEKVLTWPEEWCMSYKNHFIGKNNPSGPSKDFHQCRVLYFHGYPKPWDIDIKKLYNDTNLQV